MKKVMKIKRLRMVFDYWDITGHRHSSSKLVIFLTSAAYQIFHEKLSLELLAIFITACLEMKNPKYFNFDRNKG